MKITLMDIFYTGSMIFAAFYGGLLVTKYLVKVFGTSEDDISEEVSEKESEAHEKEGK